MDPPFPPPVLHGHARSPESFLSLNDRLYSSSGVSTPPHLSSVRVSFSISLLRACLKKRKRTLDFPHSRILAAALMCVCAASSLCGSLGNLNIRLPLSVPALRILRYLFSCVYLIYYQVFSQALDESGAILVTFCLFNKVVFPGRWNTGCRLAVSRTAALYTRGELFSCCSLHPFRRLPITPRLSPPLYSISITAAAAKLKCHRTAREDKDFWGFQMEGN